MPECVSVTVARPEVGPCWTRSRTLVQVASATAHLGTPWQGDDPPRPLALSPRRVWGPRWTPQLAVGCGVLAVRVTDRSVGVAVEAGLAQTVAPGRRPASTEPQRSGASEPAWSFLRHRCDIATAGSGPSLEAQGVPAPLHRWGRGRPRLSGSSRSKCGSSPGPAVGQERGLGV